MAGLEISRTVVDDKPGLIVRGALRGSSVLEVFFECDGDYRESLVGQEGRFRSLPQVLRRYAKEQWPKVVKEFYLYRVHWAFFDEDSKIGGGILVFISLQVPQLDLIEEVGMFVELMARRILV